MMKMGKPKNDLNVDIRFLLANERTLLAWVRTGLTLIAGGVGVSFISTDSKYGTIAGIGAIAFGGALALIGYARYRIADTAIRVGKLPSTGFGGMLVVAGVVLFALALVIVKEMHLLR
jgi:putative membrane protein